MYRIKIFDSMYIYDLMKMIDDFFNSKDITDWEVIGKLQIIQPVNPESNINIDSYVLTIKYRESKEWIT